jgi:tetratricopeptide (TPR) repeat protein
MRFHPLVLTGVIAALSAAPAAAQLRSSRPAQPVVNLPRLMVANPHSFSPQDSAAAVRIGAGMRDRIERNADRWFKTVQRAQMNEALQQYAYPVDAVLPPMVAQQLASSLSARTMVVSTILKGEGGRYTLETRLVGVSDDAGHVVRVTQAPNQSYEEFGARAADSLGSAFKALQDARLCESTRLTNAAKATESAIKALHNQPNDGLAEWCLAQIAKAKKGPVDSIIAHLKNASRGDPLSLKVWTDLAVQYQAKGDSNATIETFKQMLRVAPTNEALRKEAFQLFQRYGHPDAAEDVAREGLKIDDKNTEFWDLLYGACIVQGTPEKNKCAIEAMEQVYAIDSTKADTTFFIKVTLAASQPPPDTARFLKWAQKGASRYPNNGSLLAQLASAYSLAGPVDSAVSVTKRLMAVDSSDVTPVLKVAKTLADTSMKRPREALALAPYIERLGSADDKRNMAVILATGALPLLQPPADWAQAAEIAREAIKLAPPNTQTQQFGNFILGLAAFQMVADMDKEATSTKSCPMARQMKALLDEAGPALLAGKAINETTIAPRLASMDQFNAHVNSLIKAYCK